MEWLREDDGQYELIFIDPPTFSNSKRMEGVFDVQRDHVELLDLAMARLAPGGVLYFSNNFRKFELDEACRPAMRSKRSLAKPSIRISRVIRRSIGPGESPFAEASGIHAKVAGGQPLAAFFVLRLISARAGSAVPGRGSPKRPTAAGC